MIGKKRFLILIMVVLLAIAACAEEPSPEVPLTADEVDSTAAVSEEIQQEREGAVDLAEIEREENDPLVLVGALNAAGVDILASALSTGYDIYNMEGEEIGEAEDFLIDTATGYILYLLVEYGGYAGIGATTIPIPLAALEWRGEEQLYLQVPEEYLEALNDLPEGWPQSEGEDWDESIQSFWNELGIELIPEAGTVEDVRRYSALFQTAAQAEEAGGVIADLVIDLTHGRVKYALLDFGESTWRVVPWGAIAAATNFLVFDPALNAERLLAAPRVPTDLPPLHTDPAWDDEMALFWAEAGFPVEELDEE